MSILKPIINIGCSDKTCQLLPSGEITVLNKLSTCIMKIPNIPHSSHHWLGMDPGPKKLHQKSFVSLWQDLSKLSNQGILAGWSGLFRCMNVRRKSPMIQRVEREVVSMIISPRVQWHLPSSNWVTSAQFTSCHCPPIFISGRVTVHFGKVYWSPLTQKSLKRIKHICYIQKLDVRRCDGFGLHFHIFYENRTGKPCLFVRKASLGIITERTDAGKATPIMKVIINSRWWNCHIKFLGSVYIYIHHI